MRSLALLFTLVLLGCDNGFRPETLISDLRLIGIRAEPPDLQPGEATQLTALVLDPQRKGSSVLWIGCAADPFAMNRSPCTNPDVLNDPSALTGGSGMLPEGVEIIGFNQQATYRAPANLFEPLSADDPRRQTGTVGIVIAFAVNEVISPAATQEELAALFARIQRKETKSILALFRIPISENSIRNLNPTVDSLIIANETWPTNARVLLREREPVFTDLKAPDASFEKYTQSTPEGPVEKTERILIAWYSSAGRFTETNTALNEDVRTIFRAPGTETDPVPDKRTGTFFTVIRDTRGGNAWREWPFFVCDDAAMDPQVTSVDWPVSGVDPVTIHGSALSSIVDVVVDGIALENGSFSSADGVWRGFLPMGVEVGVKRGRIFSARCNRPSL